MSLYHKILMIAVIMTTTIGCDQVTKTLARNDFQYSASLSFFDDTIRIEYAENAGAMLGLGADLPFTTRFWFVTVFTALFLLVVPAYIFINQEIHALQVVGLSLALGGGASNLIDRWFNDGKVIDFLNIGFHSIRTGIFNCADFSVLLGFGLFLAMSVRWDDAKA